MSEEQRLGERLGAWAAAPEDSGDWKDVLRRAGETRDAPGFSRRGLVLASSAALVVAASLVGVFVVHGWRGTSSGSPTGPTGPTGAIGSTGALGPTGAPTWARPLLGPPHAKPVSLSDAATALGGPVVLPDTTQVTPSDVGGVWMFELPTAGPTAGSSGVAVAVTFPSQGLIIRYERPPIPDPLKFVQSEVKSWPGSHAISLNSLPALAIPANPNGSNWGAITFVVGETTIVVMGHSSEAFLQGVAQSIVDQAAG